MPPPGLWVRARKKGELASLGDSSVEQASRAVKAQEFSHGESGAGREPSFSNGLNAAATKPATGCNKNLVDLQQGRSKKHSLLQGLEHLKKRVFIGKTPTRAFACCILQHL